MKIVVTGSSGLIGSEVVRYFDALGWTVHGVDNNMRAEFFCPGGDTRWNQMRLETQCSTDDTSDYRPAACGVVA